MNQDLIVVSQSVHALNELFDSESKVEFDFKSIAKQTEELLTKGGLPVAFYTNVKRSISLIHNILQNDTPLGEGVKKLSQCYQKLTKAVDQFITEKYPDEKIEECETLSDEDALEQALNAPAVESIDAGDGDNFETCTDSVPDDMKELLDVFITTQQAKLEELEEIILDFEQKGDDAESNLLRELHTLKGELGVLGLQRFALLIHGVEQKVTDGTMTADALFRLKDILSMKFNDLSMGENTTITSHEKDAVLNSGKAKEVTVEPEVLQLEQYLVQLKEAIDTFESNTESLQHIFKPLFKTGKGVCPNATCTSLINLFTLLESFLIDDQLDFASIQKFYSLIESKKELIQNNALVEISSNEMNQVLVADEPKEKIVNAKEPSGTVSLSIASDKSFLEDFVTESKEHLTAIENTLLDLEADPKNSEYLNLIFRGCHTIKGIAGFLELIDIQELAHNVENLMDRARQNTLTLDQVKIDILLESIDVLSEFISIVEEFIGTEVYRVPKNFAPVMIRLTNALEGKDVVVDHVESPKPIADTGIQTTEVSGTEPAKKTSVKKSGGVDETVRVPIGRLDQLIDAIGEAVIAQSMISADPVMTDGHLAHENSDVIELQKKVASVDQIMRQIQELSMSLRTISIKPTFQKMARLVRDFSKKSGKNIQFVMEGEDTELDKSVVESIADPLMHMIRNSVDHGIEPPEKRKKMGKIEPAQVVLRAFQAAGNINIEIEDNGGGLDVEKLRAKALSQGLIHEHELHSDSDIQQLIFHPGFSTADKITDISGRGVGMDVVRRNIEKSRGSIETRSEKGIGTTFIIKLPLTLAIIDGMVVNASGQRYIIPTLSIIDSLRPEQNQIGTAAGKGEYISVRGDTITLVRLSDFFELKRSTLEVTSSIVMIVEDMLGKRIGLCVDAIVGQQQVVIKSLGEGIGSIDGVSGGAIMSDGEVSMILDISAVVQSTMQ